MIYILLALKAEAQAFIDKKIDAKIIVSGIGSKNMYDASKGVVKTMQKDDIIINVGICGACEDFNIGELLEISVDTLKYDDKYLLSCVDFEVKNKNQFDIVDMESSGFIDATKGLTNRYIFKVVSDHFEPKKITKDGAKKLIYNQIDEIIRRIQK